MATVRVAVAQTAVRVDNARIARVAGARGSKPPPPIRRRVQAGICIFRIADGFGGRVALAPRGAGKVGPQGSFGHAVFVGQADFGIRQKEDFSGDVFITAAVGDGILRDTDHGVQDSVPEVRFEVGQESGFGVVFVVVAPHVGVARRCVVAVTRGIPGRGLAIQPLVNIRLGIAVVSVASAVTVRVRRLLRVKAFQGDHFLGYQARSAVGRVLGSHDPPDHFPVVFRVRRLDDASNGQSG